MVLARMAYFSAFARAASCPDVPRDDHEASDERQQIAPVRARRGLRRSITET